ncbi:MAG: energy-coupling factor ABC transporter ATP-binding protein, partial [Culicoidibacterales bacterium]
DFYQNQTIALVGKNGSGKSTFVQMLLGIVPEFSFELECDGQKFTSLEEVRNILGIVFQYPDDQFLGSTVEEELFLNCLNQGRNQTDIDELIRLFKLENLLMRSPFELSGGQKQILAFVITLLSNPKLLILDEATSMLDPQSKEEFLAVVMNYQKKHQIALIHITHDLNELYLFDSIAYLNNGQITFFGSYQEFINKLEQIDEFYLPQNLVIAKKLVELQLIKKIPTNEVEWEELAWVLKSLI